MTALSPSQAASEIKKSVEQRINRSIKLLLVHKHLYQSVTVELGDGPAAMAAAVTNTPISGPGKERNIRAELGFHAATLLARHWYVTDPGGSYTYSDSNCLLQIPDIKTYCETCSGTEPFNLVASSDYFDAGRHPMAETREYTSNAGAVQIFVFSFLCQGCKKIPEVFMVR